MREKSRRIKELSLTVKNTEKLALFNRHSVHGSEFVKTVILPYSERIESELRDRRGMVPADVEVLKEIDSMIIAGITLSTLLDNLVKGEAKRTLVCSRIGDHLNQEANMALYTERNAGFLDFVFRKYPKSHRRRRMIEDARKGGEFGDPSAFQDWTDKVKVTAGMRLVKMLVDMGLLVEYAYKSKRSSTVLRWSDSVLAWGNDVFDKVMFLRPTWVPLTYLPSPYVAGENHSYGYKFPSVPVMKNGHKTRENTSVPDTVLRSLYKLSSQAWRINTEVYEVMRWCVDAGLTVGDLPSPEPLEIPPFPDAATVDEVVKAEWKSLAHRAYIENAKTFSKRVLVHRSMSLISEYLDTDFYFLYQMDSRGRAYPLTSTALTPQGSDFSKALLKFSDKDAEPVGNDGLYWLMVHTANTFGNDKLPYQDRVDWVYSELDTIRVIADRPLETIDTWSKADSPWQFLAACMELRKAMDEGESYCSSLPIHFDGSCSGIQHYSLLLRDHKGCESVNLTASTFDDKPKDVYIDVLNTLLDNLKASEDEMAKDWLDIEDKMDRSLTKGPTMTYVYSATRFSFTDGIAEWVRDKFGSKYAEVEDRVPDLPDWVYSPNRFHHCVYLSKAVNQAIAGTLSKTVTAMDWLKECADIISRTNVDITWVSPCGVEVSQRLVKQDSIPIQTRMFGTFAYFHLNKDTNVSNGRRHRNSIAPNFVHSLDSSHLLKVAEIFPHSLATVHDSFATTPARAESLRWTLIEELKTMYDAVSLSEYKEYWEDRYNVKLPTVPLQGSYNLANLDLAVYAFS